MVTISEDTLTITIKHTSTEELHANIIRAISSAIRWRGFADRDANGPVDCESLITFGELLEELTMTKKV